MILNIQIKDFLLMEDEDDEVFVVEQIIQLINKSEALNDYNKTFIY